VGYGDFGAYNTMEILVTCLWMFLGVAFYSFVAGSLISIVTNLGATDELLEKKIDALEDFAEETALPDNILT